MRAVPLALVGTAAITGLALGSGTAVLAQTPTPSPNCAVYPGTCEPPGPPIGSPSPTPSPTRSVEFNATVATTQAPSTELSGTTTGGATLPLTGGDVGLLLAVGAGAVGTGTLFVVLARRRRAAS